MRLSGFKDLSDGGFLQKEDASGQGNCEVVVFSFITGIGVDNCFSHASLPVPPGPAVKSAGPDQLVHSVNPAGVSCWSCPLVSGGGACAAFGPISQGGNLSVHQVGERHHPGHGIDHV